MREVKKPNHYMKNLLIEFCISSKPKLLLVLSQIFRQDQPSFV